jgi:hypothetical protein
MLATVGRKYDYIQIYEISTFSLILSEAMWNIVMAVVIIIMVVVVGL